MKIKILFTSLILIVMLAGCQPSETDTPVPEAAAPTATTVPTDPPAATDVPPTDAPPTATEVPPTETATEVPPTATETLVPEAIVINDTTAADGCTLVDLAPAAWSPLYLGYTAGSDPFFLIHTNDDAFFFSMELYTVYGSGWTGQTGSFEPDCNANGICVYLVPDAVNPYLATEGEVEIDSLSQTGGAVDLPVKITLRDITFEPAPGSASSGCFHVEQVEIEIEDD